MEEKKISLIIPVYRHPDWVKDALLSAQSQTWQNLEILLIDDGSPDGCGALCDEFAAKDSRITVFHTENAGVSSARNLGLKHATGDYISFLDSDDVLEPDHLEQLARLIEETGADIASLSMIMEEKLGANQRKEDASEVLLYSQEQAVQSMHREEDFNGYVMNKLYSATCLDGVFFDTDISIHEDMLFLWDAILRSKRIVHRNIQSYHYLIHPESAMNRGFSPRFETSIDAAVKMNEKMKLHFPQSADLSAKTVLFAVLSVANKRAPAGALDKESYKRLRAIQKQYHSAGAFSFIKGVENRISYRLFAISKTLFLLWKKILLILRKIV